MENKTDIVKCPICNWYLFNKTIDCVGSVEIKCKRCKNIVKIDLTKTTYKK